jgi:hypothetical protein
MMQNEINKREITERDRERRKLEKMEYKIVRKEKQGENPEDGWF